jgi:3-oxoacyl-[acyl-carrier-protein] synthase-1
MENGSTVCIVGIGARTPVGLCAPSSAAAVRAAISAIGEHPYFIDKGGDPMSVARDAVLPPEMDNEERFYALARPAMDEALAPLTRLSMKGVVPLVLGLPESRPGLPPNLDKKLVSHLDGINSSGVPSVRTTPLSCGHSAGLMAMEEACRRIQRGETEYCLVGGVDSYLFPETFEWLDDEGQLMSAQNRSGFPPGEGAGFCLLASAEVAARSGLPALARVVALATMQEENRIKTETICVGKGLSAAIREVSKALRLPQEKINTTYCDMNGERYRSEEFTFTALRAQAAFVDVHDFIHPADCWGDVGAASGPLFAILAIESGVRGYAKGHRALLWTSSEGGARSAAILQLTVSNKGRII